MSFHQIKNPQKVKNNPFNKTLNNTEPESPLLFQEPLIPIEPKDPQLKNISQPPSTKPLENESDPDTNTLPSGMTSVQNYKNTILPHRKSEKNGILKLIENHVTLLLLSNQYFQLTQLSDNYNGCVQCLLKKDTDKKCVHFKLFCKQNALMLVEELSGLRHKNYIKRFLPDIEQEVPKSVLEQMDFLFNHSCHSSKYAKFVDRVLEFFESADFKHEKARKKRNSSVSKKNKIKKKFTNKPRNQRSSSKTKMLKNKHARKHAKTNKKKHQNATRPYHIKIKNFTNLLIQWYMGKRLLNFKKPKEEKKKKEIDQLGKQIFSKHFRNSRFVLIDCRYQYEFDGGHVKGAFNIIDPAVIMILFFGHQWIGLKEFMDFLLTHAGQRIDKKMAKQIMRKFQNQQIINESDSINCRMEKIKEKDFTRLVLCVSFYSAVLTVFWYLCCI